MIAIALATIYNQIQIIQDFFKMKAEFCYNVGIIQPMLNE